jgi:hypothetical protein
MAYHGMIYIKEGSSFNNGPVYHDGDTIKWGIKQSIGTFSSTTVGFGVPLTASLPVAFGIFADDNGAALGSGVLMRAIRGRTLLTYTGGNREQEVASVIGQVVSYQGTNRHNMCGVMGSYEVNTSLTVDGQAWSTDPWIQAAVIGRVGAGSAITTINSNAVLAGVAAMSNTTSFAANNGWYTAFFAGKWSGTTKWDYAFAADPIGCNKGIHIGSVASTVGSALALGETYHTGNFFGGDDNNTSVGSGTHLSTVRVRTLLTYTSGNREQEVSSLRGQLVSKSGTNRHNMCAVLGSYEVNTGLTVDGQAPATDPWVQAAVMGRVGAGTNITTVNANGRLSALAAMSGTVSFTAQNGVYAGLYVGHWATCTDFSHGVYVESDTTAVGVYVGDTTGNSIQVANTNLTAGDSYSGVRVAVTAAACTNAYGLAGYFDSTVTGTQAGHTYNLGSWINLDATFVDNAGLLVPYEGGIYDAGGTLTTARIVLSQYQAILSSNPASLHVCRLNYNRGTGADAITAIFTAANQGSIGYTAGAGTSGTQLGYIPIADIVGVNSGNPVYIRVYDSPT